MVVLEFKRMLIQMSDFHIIDYKVINNLKQPFGKTKRYLNNTRAKFYRYQNLYLES